MSQKGFSLIEVLLVLALVVVLARVALPNWQQLIAGEKAYTTCAKLERLLLYARSLAIIKQQEFGVCLSADGAHCLAGPAGEVLVYQSLSHGKVIVRRLKLDAGSQFYWRGFGRGSGVLFLISGEVERNGSFYFLQNGQLRHRIVVNKLGGVRFV